MITAATMTCFQAQTVTQMASAATQPGTHDPERPTCRRHDFAVALHITQADRQLLIRAQCSKLGLERASLLGTKCSLVRAFARVRQWDHRQLSRVRILLDRALPLSLAGPQL